MRAWEGHNMKFTSLYENTIEMTRFSLRLFDADRKAFRIMERSFHVLFVIVCHNSQGGVKTFD